MGRAGMSLFIGLRNSFVSEYSCECRTRLTVHVRMKCAPVAALQESSDWVAPAIKERMMKKGSLMLSYQPHRGKVNFFRQVVISPQVSREDMDFLLDEIDLLGRDM
ncbi:hypothetical protein CB1_000571009 [Camelus ferus]|nr:hypothetical protein CB1_000571009 [Camelus ferus]